MSAKIFVVRIDMLYEGSGNWYSARNLRELIIEEMKSKRIEIDSVNVLEISQ